MSNFYSVDPKVVQGWTTRKFLPNPMLSGFVPFGSLFAVIEDGAEKDYIQGLEIGGIQDATKKQFKTIQANFKNAGELKTGTLFPVLSNISQLLTRDQRGGVGLKSINIDYNSGSPLTTQITTVIEINNVFDLVSNQTILSHFLVPGGLYLVIAGHQAPNDKPIDSFVKDQSNFIMPPTFDLNNGEFLTIDNDGNVTMNVDINDTHNGYIQCFLARLMKPSFSIENNKIIATLSLIYSTAFFSRFITGIEILPNVRDDLNSLSYIELQNEVTIKKKDFTPTQDSNNPKSITVVENNDTTPNVTTLAYRLGDVFDSIFKQYEIFSGTMSNNKVAVPNDPNNTSTQSTQGQSSISADTKNSSHFQVEEITEDTSKQLKSAIESFFYVYQNGADYESQNQQSTNKKPKIIWYKTKDKDGNIIHTPNNDQQTILTVADIPILKETLKNIFNEHYGTSIENLIRTIIRMVNHDFNLSIALIANDGQDSTQSSNNNSQTAQNNADASNFNSHNFKLIWADHGLQEEIKNTKSSLDDLSTKTNLDFNDNLKYFILEYGAYNSLIKTMSVGQINSTNLPAILFLQNAYGYIKSGSGQVPKIPNSTDKQNNDIVAKLFNAIIEKTNQQTDKNFPIGSPEYENKFFNSLVSNIKSQSNTTNYEQLQMLLKDYVSNRPWGFLARMFFFSLTFSIHGTFGLYPFNVVFFRGLFNEIQGFYSIMSVTHNITPDGFTTDIITNYSGNGVDTKTQAGVFQLLPNSSNQSTITNMDTTQ